MNNKQTMTSTKKEIKIVSNGYKVIQVNVSDPTDGLYAVFTPIKKQ